MSRIPEGVDDDAPLLLVEDVQTALEALGRASRARTGAKVVAVTGSVGKTSTKEMLRDVLKGQGRRHAAEASYNNHWGVPLTLARMPRRHRFRRDRDRHEPSRRDRAAVAAWRAPHVAMVTTVAPAHLAAFESLEGIAREKASIVEGLEPSGTAILNGDLATSQILIDAARARRAHR